MSVVIHYILDLGAEIFLPIVMILLSLIIGMKLKKALTSGLTLGIAFIGMNIILSFMFSAISPAADAFVKSTGIKLTTIDVGWSPLAAISWAWPYALTVFPIQIAINLIMLALGWTNCLNVDLWNVWGKILTAVIIAAITKSIPIALIIAGIQVVFELKNADLLQKQIYNITKIPGITCPHIMMLQSIILAPINRLLDFVPGINKANIDAKKLKEKIGIFGENSVMGFIVGALIAAFGGYNLKGILTTAMQVGTALVLFPMVAKLFMQALSPIADAAGTFMKKRFKGREFYIGLDWPFLAGQAEVWVTAIILVPFELALAIVLAKMGVSNVLPLGGIINICFVAPALIVTGGNLVRMIILGLVTTPIYLIVSSSFSSIITDLGKTVNSVQIPKGQFLTWFGLEAPEFRWAMSRAANVINGDMLGIVILVAYLALCFWYYKYMTKRNLELTESK
ncbi:PTS galactitol transporter subunit IIC [Haloimpatiens sp. FM7315]|uniref:PTS galactitol transporter subunit IIC n=1 Tax=Haloimpatiens sp. FM7315 TaxID=3298609 RepID=UPI00370C95AF